MDRKQAEREVRAALRDPKRHWRKIVHDYPHTDLGIWVENIAGSCWISSAHVICAPDDEYREQVGEALTLDRCIHDIVDQIMAAQKPEPPKMPEQKQAVMVIDAEDNYLDVWCDDDVAEKIKNKPFVQRLYSDGTRHFVCLDIRYDKKECIAKIEALGKE